MDNKEYLKEIYEKFKKNIQCKNLNAISEILKEHNNQDFQQYIVDVGGSDAGLFMNKSSSDSNIMINKIIPHLDKQLQLKFISKLQPGYINYNTIKLIQDKEGLLDSAILQKYISHKMNDGKFKDIIKANEALNTNILTHKSHHVSYHRKLALSRLMNMQIDTKEYQGIYDIVYAYTPEKEQFLLSQNMMLPSIADAQKMTAIIVENIKDSRHYSQTFYEGLQNYSNRMMSVELYAELQDTLPNNNKPRSYSKI